MDPDPETNTNAPRATTTDASVDANAETGTNADADTETETEPAHPPAETLADEPPSAKLVFKVLEHDAPLTQQELADETMLPRRTVRFALSRLDEAGLVDDRVSFRDARQSVYSLTDDGERITAPSS